MLRTYYVCLSLNRRRLNFHNIRHVLRIGYLPGITRFTLGYLPCDNILIGWKVMAVDIDGNTFYMRPQEWPMWYVNVSNNYAGDVIGSSGPSGQTGQFIFKRISNTNFYLISTKKWPDWYIYMQDYPNGNVRSHKGDPGPQGYWIVTKTNDEYYQFSTEKWPNWYMYMQNVGDGNVRGCKGDPGPQGKFYLMTVEVLDRCAFYITPLKWSKWYVYVVDNDTGNVQGHKDPPGSKGQFIFEQIGNEDVYLIRTIQWPNSYIYMHGYNIKARKGDPGPQGHWYVTTTKDGYKQLCTVKWPNWYMYMKNNSNGDVKDSEGDPGPQGKFRLMEVLGGECKIAKLPQLQSQWHVYVEDDEAGSVHNYLMAMELRLDICTYYIRSSKWYVYVVGNDTGNVQACKGQPGQRGRFLFTQVGNKDAYLISTIQWPDLYIYMQDGRYEYIKACKGDPGQRGHWYVTTTKDRKTQLCTVKFPNWYMYVNDSNGDVKDWEGDPGSQGKFCLMDVLGGECKYIIVPQLQPQWHVYVEDDEVGSVHSWNGPHGPHGHFIFKLVEDFYLISTQQRPDWYIYMQESDGNIRACKGDPGPQGHWNITTSKDGYKQLSTIMWPNRYMYIYMRGDGHGNTVKSWNGDPGPEGKFILNKVNE